VAVGIQRKDERHNEKLVDEISEGFNRAVGEKKEKDEDEAPKPRFVITGDARATPPPRRRQR
jgi:hypothetical protein